MYPSAPNFTSNDPYSVWWAFNRTSGQDICTINALGWVTAVRSSLGIVAAPVWDATLAAALLNAATVMQTEQPGVGWEAFVERLQSDVTAQSVSEAAVRFATWFAFYRPNRLRFDAMRPMTSAVLPTWGMTFRAPTTRRSDGEEGDRLVCYRPSTETVPSSLSASERRDAESASSIGVRVRPGESTDQAPEEIDLGPTSIPPWALGLGAALVIVAGALFVSTTQMKSPSQSRSSGRRLARANPRCVCDWMGESFS